MKTRVTELLGIEYPIIQGGPFLQKKPIISSSFAVSQSQMTIRLNEQGFVTSKGCKFQIVQVQRRTETKTVAKENP